MRREKSYGRHKDRKLFEEYVKNEDKFANLSFKVVAITGTSPGSLGFFVAEVAIRRGAKVLLLLNRNASKNKSHQLLQQIGQEQQQQAQCSTVIDSVECDLQDLASVREAAQRVKLVAEEHKGLDVLVNNAGIMATPDVRTGDGFDTQMQTNHLSHFLLTALLFGCLRMASVTRGEARVVCHSSSARFGPGGDLQQPYFQKCKPDTLGGDHSGLLSESIWSKQGPWTRYHMTKLSNAAFCMELHRRCQAEGLSVKAVGADPGIASSNLFEGGLLSQRIARFLVGRGQSAENGSLEAAMAAFSPDAESGDFYAPHRRSKGAPTKVIQRGDGKPKERLTLSEQNQENVWKWSEEALEMRFEL